jgi:hypothetical protein
MISTRVDCEYYCIGPAAKLNPTFASSEAQLFKAISTASLSTIFVCGTSWGSDLELRAMIACRLREIAIVVILDFWSNYGERFLMPNGQYVFPDYYVVMDEMAYTEAIKAGVPASIIRILGQPGLDKWVAIGRGNLENKQETHTKMKILLLTQPLSKLYGNTLGYTEQEVCEDLLKAVRTGFHDEVRIKFHPKDIEELRELYSHISIEGVVDVLFTQFDVIIGMNSMGLLHASLVGRTVISYQPGLIGEDMAITNKLGLSKSLHSFSELVAKLDLIRESIRGQNKLITEEHVVNAIWMDGKSTDRVIQFLKEVV